MYIKKIFFLDLRRVVGGRSVGSLPQELGELPLEDGRKEALVVNEVGRAHSIVSQLGGSCLPAEKRQFGDATLIKKKIKFSSYIIQSGAVAKSYCI
jgi:hypothetical protein